MVRDFWFVSALILLLYDNVLLTLLFCHIHFRIALANIAAELSLIAATGVTVGPVLEVFVSMLHLYVHYVKNLQHSMIGYTFASWFYLPLFYIVYLLTAYVGACKCYSIPKTSLIMWRTWEVNFFGSLSGLVKMFSPCIYVQQLRLSVQQSQLFCLLIQLVHFQFDHVHLKG